MPELHQLITPSGTRYTAAMFPQPDSRTLALLMVSLFAGGCGLKGPLYLPDSARDERIEAPAAPTEDPETPATPASQSQSQRERATDKAPASDTQTPVTPPDPDRPATIEPEPQSS